jgi:hypothetical protein
MRENLRRLPLLARLGAELVVVVVGVLLALSADAWNEERIERESEVRHLHALREDFTESQELLTEWADERTQLSAALFNLLERDLGDVPADSVGRWIFDGLWEIGSYQPRLTALRDLETSGEIRLLTPVVRRSIAEFSRRLGDLETIEADFTTSQQGLVDPYLVSELPLAPILAVSDTLSISQRLPARQDWTALGSTEARSLMAFKLSMANVGSDLRDELSEQLGLVLELIDERLRALGSG